MINRASYAYTLVWMPDRFCHHVHMQTKMQAKNKSYCIRNGWHMAEKVVMKEGITGLWQGAGPAAVRT